MAVFTVMPCFWASAAVWAPMHMPAIREKYHPQDVEPDFHGRNRDFHTAYYGEIVSAYILE